MLTLLASWTLLVQSQSMMGARVLLSEAYSANVTNPLDKVEQGIQVLRGEVPRLGPAAASSRWISLVDSWGALVPPGPNAEHDPSELFKALPRPEAWPMIRAGLATGPDSRLRLVMRNAFDVLLDQNGVQAEKACSIGTRNSSPGQQEPALPAQAFSELGKGKVTQAVRDLRIEASKSTQAEFVSRIAFLLAEVAEATGNEDAIQGAIETGLRYPDTNLTAYRPLIAALSESGQVARAQKFLVDLGGRYAAANSLRIFRINPFDDPDMAVYFLELYYKANRPRDVIAMLRNYRGWAVADLAEEICGCYPSVRSDLGFYAAWAFSKTGNVPLAIRILHSYLRNIRFNNGAAFLLNSIEGKGAAPFYDSLAATYPWSAQPLIYKADLLRMLGQYDEAVSLLKRALKLDPSDYRFDQSSRFLAYRELVQVFQSTGLRGNVRPFDSAVEEGRLELKARLFEDSGLSSMAEDALRRAISLKPDDCIARFELSRILASEGSTAEAAAEEEKGLGSLPNDIGEVGVLDIPEFAYLSDASLRAARKVFSQAVADAPDNPHAHFLVGLMDEKLGDSQEALTEYEKATNLDPNYLDAWGQILNLGKEGVPSTEELQTAAFTVLEADPLRRLNYVDPTNFVTDFARAYRLFSLQYEQMPRAVAGSIFPLHRRDVTFAPTGIRANPLKDGPGSAIASIASIGLILQSYKQEP